MSLQKIKPDDPRAKSRTFEFKGHKWHYLDIAAQGEQKGTIVLVHGFPDLSLAWRYQIPMLTSLGFRCLALDCMGYGGTGVSPNLQDYTFKTHADAIAHLAKLLQAPRIILGGHDWGGYLVYRAAQFYPQLVSHVFSCATPYAPVLKHYVPVEMIVKGGLPFFGYQLQLGSEEKKVESVMGKDEVRIGRFLKGGFGGKSTSQRPVITPEDGINLEVIANEDVSDSPLLDQEETAFYIRQFVTNGMEGPCNWYRTRRLNFEDDQTLPAEQAKGPSQPVLFVAAQRDSVLKPELSARMEEAIPNLTRASVDATHWCLWQGWENTNDVIQKWLEGVVLGGASKI